MLAAITQIDLIVYVPVETTDRVACETHDLPRLRLEVDEVLQEWIEDLDNEWMTVSDTLGERLLQVQQKIEAIL